MPKLSVTVMSVALVAALASSPWVVPIFIPAKPSVPKRPAPRPPAPIPKPVSQADKAALLRAMEDFDRAESARYQKIASTRRRTAQIGVAAQRQLLRESDLIAGRVVSWNIAMRLMGGKARGILPDWVGGDPQAGDKILRDAIGSGSTNIQMQARTQAFKEAAVLIGQQGDGAAGLELKSLESRLPRQIIFSATKEVKAIAKTLGLRAAEKTGPKAAGTVLDGPLPAVDIALFGWTMYDIYKLSGSAISDTRAAVVQSARQQNMDELDRTFSRVEARVARFNAAQKLANCSRLFKVYNQRPIPEMRGLVASRC